MLEGLERSGTAARATALAHYGKNECVAQALEWLGLDGEKAEEAGADSAALGDRGTERPLARTD